MWYLISTIILTGWQREWTRRQWQLEQIWSGAKKAASSSCWGKWVWRWRQKHTDVMITILLRTHIFFHRRWDTLANLILWNRNHLCICFVQQEDNLPSPELAPKQLARSERHTFIQIHSRGNQGVVMQILLMVQPPKDKDRTCMQFLHSPHFTREIWVAVI